MSKDSLIAGQSSGNLNFKTAQKIIHRLLTLDRIKTPLDEGRFRNNTPDDEPEIRLKPFTKEELAKKIGITAEELEKLNCPDFYKKMATKISMPLIRLYCSIKFVDGEYKGDQLYVGLGEKYTITPSPTKLDFKDYLFLIRAAL